MYGTSLSAENSFIKIKDSMNTGLHKLRTLNKRLYTIKDSLMHTIKDSIYKGLYYEERANSRIK